MTFSIGIRTMPRKQNYIGQTLQRLLESGTLQHPDVKGLHLHHGEGISPNQNGCRALLAAAKDEAEWVIFLEDDIDVIDDFIPSIQRWLTDWERQDVMAYPLCCFYSDATREFAKRGAYDIPISKYYGSQGILFRTPDAVDYANWLTSLGKSFERDVSFDIHLSQWHTERLPKQKTLVTPAPCFIDHIGEFSLMGDPGSWARVGPVEGFGGREFRYREI